MKRASGADTPKAHAVTNPVSSINFASGVRGHPSTLPGKLLHQNLVRAVLRRH
jgi:hypothetical protein